MQTILDLPEFSGSF